MNRSLSVAFFTAFLVPASSSAWAGLINLNGTFNADGATEPTFGVDSITYDVTIELDDAQTVGEANAAIGGSTVDIPGTAVFNWNTGGVDFEFSTTGNIELGIFGPGFSFGTPTRSGVGPNQFEALGFALYIDAVGADYDPAETLIDAILRSAVLSVLVDYNLPAPLTVSPAPPGGVLTDSAVLPTTSQIISLVVPDVSDPPSDPPTVGTTIPEPASLVLLCIGLAGFAGLRRGETSGSVAVDRLQLVPRRSALCPGV